MCGHAPDMTSKVTKLSEDVLNSLSDLLYVFNLDHRLILWNKRVNELTGYSNSDISAMKAADFHSEKESARLKKILNELKAMDSVSADLELITKKGTHIPTRFTYTHFKNRENDTIGISAVGREFGEEEKTQKREKHYQQLFNGMLNGLSQCEIIRDKSGKITDARFLEVNPAFENLTGLRQKEIIGKKVSRVLPGFESFWTMTYLEAASIEKPIHSVYYFKELDRYYETTAYSPHTDHLFAIFTDITDSRKAREENKLLQSQLFQAQKMEDIGRLAGGIAHDFNNLLTAIHGYTDLAIMQKDNDEKLKDSLEQINLATERAAQLAQQLLFFSKREPKEYRNCNLNKLISDLHKMLVRIIGENITIELELVPELWLCRVNKGQIEQVILNLAVNARDAMSQSGRLIIKTDNSIIDEENQPMYPYGRAGKFVCLAVEDNGTGMDQETIDQIFKAFFTTKKRGKGTGLGLSVVKSIVKDHKGWINVYSEKGIGTTFKVYIPAYFDKEQGLKTESTPLENFEGKGEKILFVEDDASIRNFMSSQLDANGYTVFLATNVKEALDICRREDYNIDLLFTDSVLPDKSGTELIDTLFSHNPDFRIILTSGYSLNNDGHPVLSGKSFHFIGKPYTLNDSLKAIRASLDAN
jgi:PAS domain S-box-containing protein